jgi:prevent-host-death family protein
MEVNIHEAKTHLSKLLQRVAVGEEIIIARAGVPVARLVPVQTERRPRPLGMDRGLFEVPEDFDAPLPPQILAAFAGDQSKKNRPTRKRRHDPRRGDIR